MPSSNIMPTMNSPSLTTDTNPPSRWVKGDNERKRNYFSGAVHCSFPRHAIHQADAGCCGRAEGHGSFVAAVRRKVERRPDRVREEAGLFGHRLQIDNAGEEGVVCQNGTLESILDDPVAPPFPLHTPTIVPPYQPDGLD